MTLDGHIKTGLAGTLLLSQMLPSMTSGILDAPQQAWMLPWLLAIFFLGNIGPDLTEMRVIPHRTYTHYPWFYVLISVGAFADLHFSAGILPSFVSLGLIAYSAGCLMHILCDIPYGGIPYLRPSRKHTFMQIPFDSRLNRVIEHSVLCTLLISFVLYQMPVGTVNGWIDAGQEIISTGQEVISEFSTENAAHPEQTKP